MNLFSFFRRKSLPKSKNRIDDVCGEHYDLQSVYNRLNAIYFNDKLDLSITWFGCPHRSVKTQRILGLYEFKSRLIKVHRLLDHPRFPPYFISYIIHIMRCSIAFFPLLKGKKGAAGFTMENLKSAKNVLPSMI